MKTSVNEISIRYNDKMKIAQAPKISSSNHAFEVLYASWNLDCIGVQGLLLEKRCG